LSPRLDRPTVKKSVVATQKEREGEGEGEREGERDRERERGRERKGEREGLLTTKFNDHH
jgi:hypothetical protein